MAMTFPFVAVISILVLTGATWILNKVLPWRVCAICAGVSVTWLWMIGARMLGYNIDILIPAVLMGGSVVGAAYQLETKLPLSRSPFLWKTLFVPIGFLSVIYLVLFQWLYLFLALIVLAIITALFFYEGGSRAGTKPSDKQISELEREMDKCC